MVVSNAVEDQRFFKNPLVLNEPHIRFYAGTPIFFENHKIGTCCIIDTKARSLSPQETTNTVSAWKN